MNQPKLFLRTVFLVTGLAIFAAAASAQTERRDAQEPNFEVALHVILGSNAAATRQELPAALANISKQIKTAAPYSSYRVANTYLARIGNSGSYEYKSVADLLGQPGDADSVSFLEWSLGGLRAAETGSLAQSFRFGARVPVKTVLPGSETGQARQVINYEAIGLNLAKLGVADNVPTLLGTLMLPRSNETLFLVVTVTRTDR